jgi:hypothetical protein
MMMIEPSPTAAHRRHRVFDRQEDAIEIDRDLSPPIGERHLDGPTQDADAGIRDHHIEASKALFGSVNDTGSSLPDADVLAQKNSLAAGLDDPGHERLAARIREIGNHHLGAFARERYGTDGADPRGTIATLHST